MSVSAPEQPSWILEPSISPGRRIRNGLATVWMVGSVLLAIVPLVLVFGYVLMKGLKIVDWSFLTEDLPIISRKPGGGMYPAIVGTIVITFWATVMAVPLGVLAAVYLTEYGRTGRLPGLIRFMADVMTGVPSIVMGLFVYTIWVLDHGLTGFAGSLALGALMLPIVIRSTEEMLRLVPDDLRRAATHSVLAGGEPRSQWYSRPPFPASFPERCWPSHVPPAKPHRCCLRSGRPGKPTGMRSKV